jgi:Flp pilus assembly protein protease CpaA
MKKFQRIFILLLISIFIAELIFICIGKIKELTVINWLMFFGLVVGIIEIKLCKKTLGLKKF